jgi:arginase
MAVSALTGHGDAQVQAVLPAIVTPDRVALVGLHSWTDDDYPHLAEWGLQSFGPDELRVSSAPLLDWLAGTGCSRAAVHFDVDTVDSNEIVLGLGAEPGGLTSAQVRRIVADVDQAVDVVGLPSRSSFRDRSCTYSRSSRVFRSLKVTPQSDNRPVLTALELGITAVHLRCPSAGTDR